MAQRIRFHEELCNDDSLCRYLPELKEPAQQLHGAEAMHRHLCLNLGQLCAWRRAEAFSRTLQHALGSAMTYCVYKMATSAWNMALHHRRRLDPITRCLDARMPNGYA